MTSKKENETHDVKQSRKEFADSSNQPDNESGKQSLDGLNAEQRSFLKRWSDQKAQEDEASNLPVESADDASEENSDAPLLTDDDMPPLDSLTEQSDFSMFMSSGVSEALRHRAIAKMMSMAGLHPRDGLDDYDDDFRSFAPLGDTITSDMKYAEQRKQQLEAERAESERIVDAEESSAVESDQPSDQQDDPPSALTDAASDDATTTSQEPLTTTTVYATDTLGVDSEMAAVPSAFDLTWSTESPLGQARAQALSAFDAAATPIPLVSLEYASLGRVLVLGASERACAVRDMLRESTVEGEPALEVTCIVTGMGDESDDAARTYRADAVYVSGYLGAFDVSIQKGAQTLAVATLVNPKDEQAVFDVIVDTGKNRTHPAEVPPPGYIDACGVGQCSESQLSDVRNNVMEMTGEFSKPRYFQYNADICAHGRSKVTGCTRCIDACPTLAIRSIGDTVEVNPYLCQGGGTCTAMCPTGAIVYALPTVRDIGHQLKASLKTWFANTDVSPTILFYDDAVTEMMTAAAQKLPDHVLPVAVEEIGSVGPELISWLLASGAGAIKLLVQPHYPARVTNALASQHALYAPIFAPLGVDGDRWSSIYVTDSDELIGAARDWPVTVAVDSASRAQFVLSGDKRNDLRMVVDHLVRVGDSPVDKVELPQGAAFGAIVVNDTACTLCMSCAGVCPTGAIQAGGDTPALRFTEWSCVQCGTCESACPEQAIRLQPQFVYDNDQRMSMRTLNEDEPFACVSCGKPFATTRVMKRMEEKLTDHWMFNDPEKMNRLRMCEDCRVKALFAAEGRLSGHKPS